MSHDSATPRLDEQQVLAEIDRSLQESGLDAGARETMLRQFESALQQPQATPGASSGWVGPDPQVWADTLDMLQREQVIAPDDRAGLQASFDRAMQGLQNDTLRGAVQGATGGELSAEQWRAGRTQAQAASDAIAPPNPLLAASLAPKPARRPKGRS